MQVATATRQLSRMIEEKGNYEMHEMREKEMSATTAGRVLTSDEVELFVRETSPECRFRAGLRVLKTTPQPVNWICHKFLENSKL